MDIPGIRILGDISKSKVPRLEKFRDRNILLDCRGYVEIHPEAGFGFNISIYTQSHDISDFGKVTNRKVVIGKNAFIGSNSVLYSCTIGEGAIVSAGTVVSSRNVPDNVIVEGNPPYIIAEKINGEWQHFKSKTPIERV